MTWNVTDTDRLNIFNELFQRATGDSIDLNEFIFDDYYAFTTLKRASETNSPELRRVAAHVEVQRKSTVESLTIRPLEPLDATWKLDTLQSEPQAPVENMPLQDRRTGNRLLSSEELLIIGRFKRLYQQEFGRQFDIDLFTRNDAYGRAVIRESLSTSNPFLVQLANRFLDASGKHTRHRRRIN